MAAFSAALPPAAAVAPGLPSALACPGSKGRSMTCAPCLAAYLIPAAIAAGSAAAICASASSGSPGPRVTLTDRIRAAGATPMTPDAAPPDPCP